MVSQVVSELPADLTFCQEWQRVVFAANGERVETLDSKWYRHENVARILLNSEYPEPTATGWRMRLQTRWVSEYRPVED